jgi:prepilin-type N-terminal cleavage/methylation domain-containing protein
MYNRFSKIWSGDASMFKKIENKKTAFTMIEMIIVITVLGILVTLASLAVKGTVKSANNSAVKSDMASIQSALEVAKLREGETVFKGAEYTDTITNLTNSKGEEVEAADRPDHLYRIQQSFYSSEYIQKIQYPDNTYLIDDSRNVYYLGLLQDSTP